MKTSGDLFSHNNGLKKPCKFAAGCRGRAIVLVEIAALSWAVLFKRCLSAYVEEAQSFFFLFLVGCGGGSCSVCSFVPSSSRASSCLGIRYLLRLHTEQCIS